MPATSLKAPTVLFEVGWQLTESRVQPLLIVDASEKLADPDVGIRQIPLFGSRVDKP